MSRRCFTIVLSMAYLASQLAVVSHSHGASRENQPVDHHARPHIHVSSFGHADHSHDLDHGHPYSHRSTGTHSHTVDSETPPEHSDHDSDAVYLPSDTGQSLLSKSVATPNAFNFVTPLVAAIVVTPTDSSDVVAASPFPGECRSGSHLDLALRIAHLIRGTFAKSFRSVAAANTIVAVVVLFLSDGLPSHLSSFPVSRSFVVFVSRSPK